MRLVEAEVPPQGRPGGQFVLQVQLHNDGWAALFNARPVFVTLFDETNRYDVELTAVDPRTWAAGEDATSQPGSSCRRPS